MKKLKTIFKEIVMKRIMILVPLFLLFFLATYNKSEAKPNEGKMEKVTKRVGSLIKVKPEYEERYIILHKYTFPGVLERISKSNIRNYSIFLLDGILFSYYEYIGNDFESDMEAIADPTTKDWWKLTDPMQEPLTSRKEGEWWAEMEQFLTFDKLVQPSVKAQRIGLVAEVIPGKEDEIKNLCKNTATGLEEATNKENFQNCHLYYKDRKIYYYYEYVGNDIRKSFTEISKNEIFQTFQSEMNKFLIQKENGSWQIMKEVFHTD
jgi:L-rhamnose mutarotase